MGVKEGNDEGGKGDGDGDGDKEGDGDRPRQHRQWRQKRGWRASDGGNNGDGEGDGTKDMAAHTTPGEREMMVVMDHGLCVSVWVSEEVTKNNKGGPKKVQCVLEHWQFQA